MLTRFRPITRAVVASMLVFAAACSSNGDGGKATSAGDSDKTAVADGNDDSSNGDKRASESNGSDSGDSGKSLPSDWPNDLLPIPDGFTITTVAGAGGQGSTRVLLKGPGGADMSALLDDYESRLSGAGFEITDRGDDSLQARKPDANDFLYQYASVDFTGTLPGKITQMSLAWQDQTAAG